LGASLSSLLTGGCLTLNAGGSDSAAASRAFSGGEGLQASPNVPITTAKKKIYGISARFLNRKALLKNEICNLVVPPLVGRAELVSKK
jgi:hypothetical protein